MSLSLCTFVASLARECSNAPGQVAYVASKLFAAEKLVRRADEADCNGTASARRMRDRDDLIGLCETVAAIVGATLVHNPDPRGLTFELHFASGRTLGV